MLRVACRLISAILTCSKTCRGPGTVTRLMMTIGPAPPVPDGDSARPPPPPLPPPPPPPIAPPPPATEGRAAHECQRHELNDVGHRLRVGDLAVKDDLRAHLADLDLGAGKRLANPRLQVLGIERDPNQERDRPIGLVPHRQAGRAERLAVEIEQPRARLVGEQLDIGDGRVGDDDPRQIAAGLDDLGLPFDHADLGLRLLDHLDQLDTSAATSCGVLGSLFKGGRSGTMPAASVGDADHLGRDRLDRRDAGAPERLERDHLESGRPAALPGEGIGGIGMGGWGDAGA